MGLVDCSRQLARIKCWQLKWISDFILHVYDLTFISGRWRGWWWSSRWEGCQPSDCNSRLCFNICVMVQCFVVVFWFIFDIMHVFVSSPVFLPLCVFPFGYPTCPFPPHSPQLLLILSLVSVYLVFVLHALFSLSVRSIICQHLFISSWCFALVSLT